MYEYYVTFGSQYAYQPHPTLDWVNPNGYLTIVADSYNEAREYAFALTDGIFAFIYASPLESRHFPLGELKRLTVPKD